MVSDGALLTGKFEDERLELAGGGSWTAAHAGELETLVDGVARRSRQGPERFDRHGRGARVRHLRRLAAGAPHARVGAGRAASL